ncbi:hypothetical protein [Mesorhizobium sp. M0802]
MVKKIVVEKKPAGDGKTRTGAINETKALSTDHYKERLGVKPPSGGKKS